MAKAGAVGRDGARVLVVGDTIVDVYVHGTAIGKSSETPTLVAREQETRTSLGGACLVVRNLLALGAQVDFVTGIGEDAEAELVRRLQMPGLFLHGVSEGGRRTTAKKRYWVDGYKLLQFDQLDNRPWGEAAQDELLRRVRAILPGVARVIISDYRHGLLSPGLVTAILEAAAAANKAVYVDSQVAQSPANHHWYRGADLVCLNRREAEANGLPADGPVEAGAMAAIAKRLGIADVVVKLGEAGAAAWIAGASVSAPGWPARVVDTIGAGDAFLAALALADLRQPEAALRQANCWAGLSTEMAGPEPPALDRFLAAMAEPATIS